MSCLHIQGTQRSIIDSGPLRYLSPKPSKAREFGIRINAAHANPKIRAAAAASYDAPLEVLETLANDVDASVRAWVARNDRTPAHLLERLADDHDTPVRAFVAWAPNTPEQVVCWLTYDQDNVVRAIAAGRYNEENEYLSKG